MRRASSASAFPTLPTAVAATQAWSASALGPPPAASPRPRFTFWQIWHMCFGFVGIQFALALQNSNLSRIFQTLGASVHEIPILWIAAPLTGLLVQPCVGYLSDRTWSRFGRRGPYLLAGALLAALALIAMPNSPTLWMAAALLWLLDAAINVAMGPVRALIGDQLPPEQRPAGYAMQTFFICAGAVIASILPWLLARAGCSNVAEAGQIPDTVRFSFYAGAAAMFAALGWSVWSTREYTPEQLAAFDDGLRAAPTPLPRGPLRRSAWRWSFAGLAALFAVYVSAADRQLYILAGGILAYGVAQLAASFGRLPGLFAELIADMHAMPASMRRLALVQMFSWFALCAMWIYTSAAVANVHFGATDTDSPAYNAGANWAGVLFAAYNAFAIPAAMIIPWMTRRLGLHLSHLVNLSLGGLGLISFLLIRDPHWLLLSMVGVGFTWASVLSLPYAMLSDSVPTHKMGAYMGIFNFFIVVPQLLGVGLLGFLLRRFFGNAPIDALLIGGICLLIAAAFNLRIATPR